MSTEITVRGAFSAFRPAERGTVHATVAYEGPEMEPVYARVATDLAELKSSIVALEEQYAVTWWSADQLRTWSNRPWNDEGKQLPLVHHASVSVEAKFRDFAALSRWVGEHDAAIEGFRTSRVEWALTAVQRDAMLIDVRTRAVSDAVSRAQQYADALGLGPVAPVAVADSGMLNASHESGPHAAMRVMAAPGGGPVVELVPKHIEVSATVEARFVAGPTA
ncbi:SIMPL domain-containing protein [Mycobacterium neglectum]|uniref:SIMPL domain-containing protein n=1 Tax=Mycobacterium neglectum TaxID=242737 RepID=UPI000BFEDC97|nr:SIMPL domain-containing protein [Mycobacterium neglectum]